MSKKKNNQFDTFVAKNVAPPPSETYDGQNLTVMQGVMGQKYDERTDRSSSVWKTIKKIILIGVIVFCFIYMIIVILQGNGLMMPRVR